MDSSTKRIKIAGAVGAVALLVIFGVVALNNASPTQAAYPNHAEAIVRAENADAPMSQLPDESAVATPQGWVIDSDSPVEGAPEEEVSTGEDNDDSEALESDDDIDSPVMVEQDDETGEKFVAEMGDDVIMDDDEEDADEAEAVEVGEDAKNKRRLRCKPRLRRCGSKNKCKKICGKKCRPVVRRVCRNKKFCRCFCKYKANKKAAVKCVTYKRKQCRRVRKYLCKRRCRKFCKRVPHCYCCTGRRVRRLCRRTCTNMMIKTKCGNCRCRKLKCFRTCILLCKK